MLKLKITWPLVFLILLAALSWLFRSPAASPTQRRPSARSPRQRPARSHAAPRRAPRRAPRQPFTIDQQDGAEPLSYADAVRDPAISADRLAAIAARENRAAIREALDATPSPTFKRRPSWRTS